MYVSNTYVCARAVFGYLSNLACCVSAWTFFLWPGILDNKQYSNYGCGFVGKVASIICRL